MHVQNIEYDPIFRVLDIVKGTTVDGPGFRTSIYLAGCDHFCEGCHNPQSWDFNGGREMRMSQLLDIIRDEDFDVTLTGGDPLYHPKEIKAIVDEIVKTRHTVWIYTGFEWDEIIGDELRLSAVEKAEAVVEGRFILNLRDTDLLFRGSSNQRIIDVASSLAIGMAVLY